MKIALERHAYAPELNRALILNRNGDCVATLPAPGCASIRDARRALFAPVEPRRIVEATKARPAPWEGLNRTLRAAYPLEPGNLATILEHARRALPMESECTLDDGRALPASRLKLSTRLGAVKVPA